MKERAHRRTLQPPAETSGFALMFLFPLNIRFVRSQRRHDLRQCSLRCCKKCKHEGFITDPNFRGFDLHAHLILCGGSLNSGSLDGWISEGEGRTDGILS
jgi:hypothetical protein